MTLIARVVFVLLVGATFSAFFVAQRLKSTPSVVEVRKLTKYFSPNGDGRRDAQTISLRLKEADDVTVSVVNADGDEVRRLADGQPARAFTPIRLTWDGRTDSGARAPDGLYRLRVALRRQGRVANVPSPMNLDTTAPTPRVAAIKPPIGGPEPGAFTVYLRGVSPRKATGVRVLRTDVEPAREVARFSLAAGKRKAVWDGKVGGAPAPPGTYIVVPAVEDRAGNIGTAPAELPPSPDAVPGRPGITVRTIAGSLPTEPVRAGQRVRFFVDSRRRDFSWRVRRLGGGRVRARGRGQPGKPLSVKAPSGVSGVYLLQVRSGRYATQVPFAVQSSERADVQVVLPVISWLGLDPVDDDGNGVPNTLSNGGPVRYAPARLLAGGADRLPAGFADEVAPLLVYLDRARIRYDVTTDLALVGSRSPRAGDRKGVLLPGSMRWVPRDVARRLRRYVQDGGHVASFGTDTLRRGVDVTASRLVAPTQPTDLDPFGTRLGRIQREPAGRPLVPTADDEKLGLYTGFDGTLEGFSSYEPSEPRPLGGRAKVVTALAPELADPEADPADEEAHPPEPLPALTATRLGKGVVIRVGLPGWSERLRTDREVDQLTRNIVDVLRGVTPKQRLPVR